MRIILAIILSALFFYCDTVIAGNFIYRKSLECKVSTSGSSKDIFLSKKGSKFTLIDLDTKTPQRIGFKAAVTKFTVPFETDSTIVLFSIGTGTGSTDTVFLDKNSGKFSQSFGGNFIESYGGYALGSCE